MIKKILPLAILFLIPFVSAHCPLCTAGALIAASGAGFLGVKSIVLGLFIGAFAVSIGSWISNMLKKQYIPFQRGILILLSFATTILPLNPIFGAVSSIYLPWMGKYGTTYVFNTFLAGSAVGGIVMLISPYLSNFLTKIMKGRHFPFQGLILTLSFLISIAIILQVIS